MLHCLRGQTRAIPVQNHPQYVGCAGAAGPSLPASPNTQETGFHAYHKFSIHPPQYHNFLLTDHTFLLTNHTHLLTRYRILRYICKKTLYSMTQERSKGYITL